MARTARVPVTSAAGVLLYDAAGSQAQTVLLSVEAGGTGPVTLGSDSTVVAGQGPQITVGAQLPPFLMASDQIWGRTGAGLVATVDVLAVIAEP